ncbi:phage major capsid protein [Micromonospora sp. S4605]|uniref:phage major capsid protein n=1 Tax=Micromonospora sp. S4605 TaxID=1420897 RepID=UPI0018EE7030|nr:phage major capsid protein [Micromonospora sp. S4605]
MAELADKMSTITDEIDALSRKDALTPGEQERFHRLRKGFAAAMNERESLEDEQRAVELAQQRAVSAGRPGSDLVAVPGAPGIDDYGRRRDGARDQALWQIERSNKVGHLADHAAERATSLVEKLGSAREQSLAVRWVTTAGDDAYRSAFAKMIADPTRGHLLWTDAERDAYQRVALLQSEMRAMSVGTDSAGGYLVPMSLDPALNLSNAGSINPLRRISRVVQTVTDSWTGINSAGATAEWKAEGVQAADGSPTVDDEPIPSTLVTCSSRIVSSSAWTSLTSSMS